MAKLLDYVPLVKSAKETADVLPTMSGGQKARFWTGLGITAARPLARFIHESQRGNKELTPVDTAIDLAIDATDKADGSVTKYEDVDGLTAKTAIGGEADPFADKIDFNIQERAQCKRGELSRTHRVLRFGRDVIITLARSYVSAKTDGKANISAGKHGKISSIARNASLRATGTKFERTRPSFRKAHQVLATTAIVGSGIMNGVQLYRELKKHKKS